jgi:hypothetical protein
LITEVAMSALRAVPLPGNGAGGRAAASWTARTQAARTQAARGQAVRGHAAPSRTARGQAARTQAAGVPLRLTRRGRIVIAVTAALLIAVLSLVATGAAQATSHSAPPRAAQQNLSRVVVRPGQSLWSVAENADPDADTRLVIQQIIDLNGLKGHVIFTGQRLWVPRG